MPDLKKVGETITVLASEFLGTPATEGVIVDIELEGGPANGSLYLVEIAGEEGPHEVDLDGCCLIGPPVNGRLVRAE
jgi:hypothetical protein